MDNSYKKPTATIDIIIMTIINNVPHIMLTKRSEDPFKGYYSLLGGYVYVDEDTDINNTVKRILKNKVGIENIYFEQLETFGSNNRDPRGWSISVSFVSLLPSDVALKIKPHNKIEEIKWISINEIEKYDLAFDHKDILEIGIARVKSKINYSTLPIFLLPKYFTITELQSVYESFLSTKIDKSGFRKKIKEIPFLKETDLTTNKNHRPAKLYTASDDTLLDFFRSNIVVK